MLRRGGKATTEAAVPDKNSFMHWYRYRHYATLKAKLLCKTPKDDYNF